MKWVESRQPIDWPRVHLDYHNCLEAVIVKGRSGAIRDLANRILSLSGVKHGQLVITSTGKELK